jgi:DNA-binding Xre family transcriptional regulator
MDGDAYLLLKRYEEDTSAPLNAVGVTLREGDAVKWCQNQRDDESARVYQPLFAAEENGISPGSGVAQSYVGPSVLGKRLKHARETNGYSLREVEEKVGFSNAYISQLEQGAVKDPSLYKIADLCDLYDISLDFTLRPT